MSGVTDEVHDKDRKLDADLKGKLDFFLWHQRFKAGYQLWSRAHNDKKQPLLLTGPSLTVAEGWMLVHPSKFSDGERRFIMRSVAQSTQRVVALEVTEIDRRRAGRSLLIPLLAAGLVVGVIALPRFMAGSKVAIEPSPTQVTEAAGPKQNATGHDRALQSASEVADHAAGEAARHNGGPDYDRTGRPDGETGLIAGPSNATEASTTQGHGTGDADRQTARATAARLQVAAANIRKLAALSDQKLTAGQPQTGLMLAAEALHRVAALPPGTVRNDSVLPAASAVHRTLSSMAPLGARPAETMAVPSAMFCPDAKRAVVANLAQGIVAVSVAGDAAGKPVSATWPGSARPLTVGVTAESRLLLGASIDPTCSRIVLPRSDDTAEVWSLTTGQRLSAFAAHDADVTVTAISHDGRTVASGSLDMTVRLWDSTSGRARLTLRGHEGTIHALAFDARGQRVASAAGDRTVRVWDAMTGRQTARFKGYQGDPVGVAFSDDGDRVLAYGDGAVHVHTLDTTAATVVLRAPGRTLLSGQFAPRFAAPENESSAGDRYPGGDRIAAIADDGSAIVFNAETGEALFQLTRPPGEVRGVAWNRGGQTLLSYGWDGDVTLHDGLTGQGYAIVTGLNARAVTAQFSADGRHVVAILQGGTLLTAPVFASLADAAQLASQAAGGCLDEAELARLKTGPPSGMCVDGQSAAIAPQPWLIASTAKRPEARRAPVEIDLTGGPVAATIVTER